MKDSFESIVRSATFDDCSINLLVNDRMFHDYLSLTLNERAEIFIWMRNKKDFFRNLNKNSIL